LEFNAAVDGLWVGDLCRALLSLTIKKIPLEPAFRQWETSLIAINGPRVVIEWLSSLRGMIGMSQRDLIKVLRHPEANWESRVGTAALLLSVEGIDPNALFVTHYMLFSISRSSVAKYLANGIADSITAAWLRTCEQPFALLAPHKNVPAIQDAFRDERSGYKRVANLLLVAQAAVQTSLPDVARQAAQALLDSSTDGED
jgi:hypothetical protein